MGTEVQPKKTKVIVRGRNLSVEDEGGDQKTKYEGVTLSSMA